MRHSHRAGATLCVDDAGQPLPVVDALTGAGRDAALCLAVLGASHAPSAEATWSQRLPAWRGAPVRTFAALGGVPQVVGPAHRTAAVRRPQRSAPTLSRTSAELAPHSGVALVPARAARPRDQAQGEVGVQVGERGLLARRRPPPCFALLALHTALTARLVPRKQRPFQQRPGARPSVCAALARPALRPLPPQPSEDAAWPRARVHSDSHVEVAGHSDAVPSSLGRPQRAVRRRAQGVARCHTGPRVARPPRAPRTGRHTPVAVHMPQAHPHSAAWPPPRRVLWAAHTGAATAQVGATLLAARPPPPQGCRACLGLRRRGNRSGAARRDAAGQRAIRRGACASTRSASLRTPDRDPPPVPGPPAAAPGITQSQSRGAPYDHTQPGDPVCGPPRPATTAWPCNAPGGPTPAARRWPCRRARRAVAQHAWDDEASAR